MSEKENKESNIDKENIEESQTQKIIKTVIEDIDKKNKNEQYNNIITGISTLDQHLSRFPNGDLTIIASRPGVGKTTLALRIFNNITDKNIKALFISLEKKEEELLKCILSIKTKINYRNIDESILSKADYINIVKNIEPIYRNNCMHIKSFNNIDLINLKKYIKEKVENDKIEIVFIDYLHLIIPAPTYTNRWEQVCEISRTLKSMAMEFNVPFIVLSPLHRNIENEIPELKDLSESGSIEYDADRVIILYKKMTKRKIKNLEEETQDESIITVYIAKNRRGRKVKLDFKFNYKNKSIEDVKN